MFDVACCKCECVVLGLGLMCCVYHVVFRLCIMCVRVVYDVCCLTCVCVLGAKIVNIVLCDVLVFVVLCVCIVFCCVA